jgi:flagellar biosynthetic protein FliR
MNFAVEDLEVFILIVVRLSGFILTAPMFSISSVPRKVKLGLAIFTAMLVYVTLPTIQLEYSGVLGYALLVGKELIVGILVGFSANICTYILEFSGQMIDMEIGFSMINQLNPVSKLQSTITANFYTYFVMLIMLLTNLHHNLLKAIIDTFTLVPVGKTVFQVGLFGNMIGFITDYFIIGFRIILPVFAAMFLVNIILGILAKVAPQMNMFVIGMQLKILIGLFILFFIVGLLPQVTDFIFSEMKTMIESVVSNLS